MRGDARRIPALLRRGGRSPVVGGGAPGYDPLTALPTLRLALDAALGVTLSGSDITAWADQSGVGNDFVSVVNPAFSATGFNSGSQPYIEGDGATEYMRCAAFSWGATVDAMTIIEVSQNVTIVNGDYSWGYNGTGSRPWCQQLVGTNRETFDPRGTGTVTVAADTNPRVKFSVYNNTNAFIRIGDTTSAPVATTGTLADGARFCLLARGDENAARASVRYAAFYVCRAALTTQQQDDFRAYAAARWGV